MEGLETYCKGDLLAEGKTKQLFQLKEDINYLIVKNKSDITAFDDPAHTKQIPAKAKYATLTTCKIFEMLKDCGLPVAYYTQISDTEFVVPKVNMIPLEVIARRLAMGSFLDRQPNYRTGRKPWRFHRLVTEFFLKTTKGKISINGEEHDLGLPQVPAKEGTKALDDPLIKDVFAPKWQLYNPKCPDWDKAANLGITFDPKKLNITETILKEMDELNRKAFLLIEAFWANLGFVLVDWKIEFGLDVNGRLVIADVIDNDSWRLRDPEFREVSKQVFRDGGLLDDVETVYGYVAGMVSQFRLPQQALVIWRGSKKDKLLEIPYIPGVESVDVAKSGHKESMGCLKRLEEIQREFPDGGVILALIGMSNGCGPTLSSHTTWPVMSVSVTASEHPEDVWSSLRLPSQNPMATILSPENAVLFALNILAQKNPAAHMVRQFAIEQLDTSY